MHPAGRIFLGLFVLWTLIKTPLFFIAAEQTRRHLSDAPSEIRNTLRSGMIGNYGTALLHLTIVVVVGATVIRGSASFDKGFAAPLVAVFAVGLVTVAIGLKASFDSLHNPPVNEFYRRYGIGTSRFFRRDRSA